MSFVTLVPTVVILPILGAALALAFPHRKKVQATVTTQ